MIKEKNNLYYWVALNSLKNVTPRIAHLLLKEFSTPEKIFSSPKSKLQVVDGMTFNALNAILNFSNHDWVLEELDRARAKDIYILPLHSEYYPSILAQIYDPPILLYVKGTIKSEDKNAIAMVGARKASANGLRSANKIAAALISNKITLVSGMARGIDTEIHRTALKNNGRTIAVLGSGLEFIYPPENRNLYNEICHSGAVVSEFPLLTPPEPYNFPRRNRIISGLSLGTVVVEAGIKSGSLITARFALDQGREVFAIPGPIAEKSSEGTHQLIQEGAKLVQNAEDILNELNIKVQNKPKGDILDLSDVESWLLKRLDSDSSSVNNLVSDSNFSSQNVIAALTKLELRGLVKQIHGDRYIREN